MPASDSHIIDKNPVIFKEETLMELNVEEIMEILPHRYPMLLVDKITELVPMDYAVGVKSVTIFPGTFPGTSRHAGRSHL